MKKVKYVLFALIFASSLISAQSKFGVGINGGYLSSTGDLKDLFKDGFGATAFAIYNLTNNIQLSATTGYYGFTFNNDFINDQLKEAGYNKTVNLDVKMNIIPLMVGAKFFLGESQFRPYAGVDLGLHIMTIETPNAEITSSGVSTSKATETKAGYAIGAGFLYKVSDNISLDVNAKFNGNGFEVKKTSIKTQGSTTIEESSSSTSAFFSIMAGLCFQL
jgi:outer membrane protein W